MADENNQQRPEINKAINVTQPRSNPAANLDASRVV